jgi:hypothetical protein
MAAERPKERRPPERRCRREPGPVRELDLVTFMYVLPLTCPAGLNPSAARDLSSQ